MVEYSQNSSGSQNIPELTKLCNGSDAAEASFKSETSDHAIQFPAVNGNSSDMIKQSPEMNGDDYNKDGQKEIVNGYSKEVLNNVPIVNGNSHNLLFESIPTVNENSESVSENNLSTSNSDVQDEASLCNEGDKNSDNFSNGSSTLSESDSSNNSDSLYPKDEGGFIPVVNKRHKKSQKKLYQKPTSNLPPVKKDTKSDNKSDNNCEKESSLHFPQNPPPKNFTTVSTEVTYSAALLSGSRPGLKNGASRGISKCQKAKASSDDSSFSGTNIEKATVEEKISMKNQQSDLLKKVTRNDVSAQTDFCTETELSPCPKTESVQSNSSIESMDCVYVEKKEESSNASVTEVDGACGNDLNSVNTEVDGACGNDLNSVNGEFINVRTAELNVNAAVFVPARNLVPVNEDILEAERNRSEGADAEVLGAEGGDPAIVSNDSGRGDSEVSFDHQNPYFCIFPLDKVRNLIGRHGGYRSEIENRTGASFWVHTEFILAPNTTLVEFTGLESAIDNAREMIKRRFRNVTLERLINPFSEMGPFTLPRLSESIRAHLPLGIEIMSVVSCIYTPSYFWIQQFGHPEYHPLEDLEKAMSVYYNSFTDAPGIVDLLTDHLVAVPVVLEGGTKWVRGLVTRQLDNGNVLARYLDHGGEVEIPVTELREMRAEFFTISFFAAKCCLFGVLPAENQWSLEACQEFQRLCNGAQPPLVKVVYQVPEGYFVSLYGYDNEAHCRVNVAEVLVNKGLARIGDTFVPTE